MCASGLSLEGLERIYEEGASNIDRDFQLLWNKLISATDGELLTPKAWALVNGGAPTGDLLDSSARCEAGRPWPRRLLMPLLETAAGPFEVPWLVYVSTLTLCFWTDEPCCLIHPVKRP